MSKASLLLCGAVVGFSQMAWAENEMRCAVQEFNGEQSGATLKEEKLSLGNGPGREVFRESGLMYSVKQDSQGGLQLAISHENERKIVALAYSPSNTSLVLITSEPSRVFHCSRQ